MDGLFGRALGEIFRDVPLFAEAGGITLRSYQRQAAESITRSVLERKGLSFVVMFPRQSGKNELQAQIEAYLLNVFSMEPAEIVKVSPTWRPQSLNAMRRLERVLNRNILCQKQWQKLSGYIFQYGKAMIHFLSGSPTSSIVGATASILLECDEAQDVEIAKWDREIAPMAASTNATRIFWGTAWTSQTLLARELRHARQQEKADGIRRTWVLTADEVGAVLPAYRKFVDEQVSRLGRDNPMVRTQYFSEEIDSQGQMFPLERRMLMLGGHPRQATPTPGKAYVFTIDVAGQDETALDVRKSQSLALAGNPRRDSTVLTIFEIDPHGVSDSLIRRPTYRAVGRQAWQGVKHTQLYGAFIGLIELWSPVKVVIDATGVGAGLSNFLADSLGARLVPYVFNQATKSRLGWDFLSVIETGRYKEYHPFDKELERQLEYCQYSVLDGPARVMRWGVPDGVRDAVNGELVHDDYVTSAALISVMDEEGWGETVSEVIEAKDILERMNF